jgi:single-stranded-DNA-specific exonuclease
VITQTEDLRAIGSMRSNEGFNCHEFLAKYNDLFLDFGGHACAGGFSLPIEKVDELCIRISEDMDYMDCPSLEGNETLTVDTALRDSEFNQDLMKVVESFEPYGEQNDPLTFLIEGARIQSIQAMQNTKDPSSAHLRLMLSFGTYQWPSVYWSAGPKVGKEFDEGEIVDVVFRMGRNYYKNQESIQLTIQDLRRH